MAPVQDRQDRSDGVVAQLGERRVRNAEVRGSIPLGSTNFPSRAAVMPTRPRGSGSRLCPSPSPYPLLIDASHAAAARPIIEFSAARCRKRPARPRRRCPEVPRPPRPRAVRDAARAKPRGPVRPARAPLWPPAGIRAVRRRPDRRDRRGLGGAAGGAAPPRSRPRPRAGLVPARDHGRLRLLHRPLRRDDSGRGRPPRLSRRARRHLCPLHALPQAAARRQRRRLFGDGLPRGRPALRHHGRPRTGGARRSAPAA